MRLIRDGNHPLLPGFDFYSGKRKALVAETLPISVNIWSLRIWYLPTPKAWIGGFAVTDKNNYIDREQAAWTLFSIIISKLTNVFPDPLRKIGTVSIILLCLFTNVFLPFDSRGLP